MLRKILVPSVLGGLLFAALAVVARPAHAGFAIGVDLNGSKMTGDNADKLKLGTGGNLRLGYKVPVVDLQVGGLLRYNKWKFDDASGGTLTDVDAMVGGKFSIGLLLKPFAQGFLGYGTLKSSVGGMEEKKNGPSLLVGGGLDVSLLFVSVGVHVDYNKIVVDGAGTATQWIAGGIDATLAF